MKVTSIKRTIAGSKIRDYYQLVKFRLSLVVVFSAAMGYLLAAGTTGFSWLGLLMLSLGGFLLTGASNALNQVLEKDLDKLMSRTMNRPLATGRMEVSEAVMAAGLMSVAGIILLSMFNPLAAMLGAVSMLSYAFVYTPMKRVSHIAVLVGAFPGALPPLIGWVAATGTIGSEALALFGIQFMWQMPHFWSIAWLAFDDYAKAGYFLLPSTGGRDKQSAMQCVVYSLLLIPVSLFLYWLGFTGLISAIVVGITGAWFSWKAFELYKKMTRKAALGLMFSSFLYLPIVLIALVLDKV
ncbi:MAG: heme o synthase [Bacteroidota bacterium]